MGMTLSEAAEHTGKSKSVLSRAITSGKLSAVKRDDDSYDIDPAELERWVKNVARERKKNPVMRTERNSDNALENRVLQAELNAANEQKAFWKQQFEDIKTERNDWKQQAQRLLLTQGREEEPAGQQRTIITPPPVQAEGTVPAKTSLGSWLKTCPLWSKKKRQGEAA